MSFSVGIVGLPNVGKSTLFKTLTRQEVDISNYPFCTINPNVGIVQVPDERLDKIAEIVKPKKVTPTIIEFVDIAGLVKGAHKGEGLGNQFLSHIREVDAILHVVRAFIDSSIKHVEEDINPQRDIEIINTELIMKDLETINKYTEKVNKNAKSGDKKIIQELKVIEKIQHELNRGNPVSIVNLNDDEKKIIKHLNLLTIKPTVYILNIRENTDYSQISKSLPENSLPIDLKIELECTELSPQELAEMNLKSRIDVLIKTCYKILNLVSFYTIKGGEEVRAWTIREGTKITEAGGVVHTDFKEKFIRAEVINYKNLLEAGSWAKARSKGLIRTEGKDYLVKDGDIIEFKI